MLRSFVKEHLSWCQFKKSIHTFNVESIRTNHYWSKPCVSESTMNRNFAKFSFKRRSMRKSNITQQSLRSKISITLFFDCKWKNIIETSKSKILARSSLPLKSYEVHTEWTCNKGFWKILFSCSTRLVNIWSFSP
jgi:hypothetical protein